ncbi:unnamed protein product [Absidia cylindrospora]
MLSNLKSIALRSAINSQCTFNRCSQHYFSTNFIARHDQNEQASGGKKKVKPVADLGQRYQKIHHAGDVYHPQDLNDARYQDQLRQRRRQPNLPTEDPFDVLDLDPLHEYKNYRLLSHFISDMGKILPREKTGLTAKNQRKLAKSVKRARAMGLMSSTSKYISSGYSGLL